MTEVTTQAVVGKIIDALRSESGEWKIWLNTGAISLYLSLEEVRSILSDFENLAQNLSFPPYPQSNQKIRIPFLSKDYYL